MKCPNCYSRKIDNKGICELCGINTKSFKIKKMSKMMKIIIILFILIILGSSIYMVLNLNKTLNLLNTIPAFIKLKANYMKILKSMVTIIFGLIGSILMMRGSYIKSDNKKYDSYLLGKIVDYRPFKKKYHPIIEYIVNEKEYRIVAQPVKKKELEGLVGVRYESSNPNLAILDGEKNGDLDFFLGLFILIIIISVTII